MTWRLRDRKIQEKLNEVTNGDFSKRLNEVVISGAMQFCFTFGGSKFTMHLMGNDIEEIPEYNPKAWNKYPEVTPPENIFMRVEIQSPTDKPGLLRKVGAIYKNGKWCNSTDDEYPLHYKILRFRPWED